jgi:hypothetical protein
VDHSTRNRGLRQMRPQRIADHDADGSPSKRRKHSLISWSAGPSASDL